MAKKKKQKNKPKENKEKSTGRKSKYYSHVEPRLDEIKFWYMNGCIDEDVAKNLGIAVSTLYEYKNKFPEFSEACALNKEVANARVQNALFYNATIKKDFNAQKYWLQNRMPETWKDKQEIAITDNEMVISINVVGGENNGI